MRLAVPLAIVALAAASLVGCGSNSGSEPPTSGQRNAAPNTPAGATARSCIFGADRVAGLRVASVSCGKGRRVALDWQGAGACQVPAGASRAGCSVGPYRCSAMRVGRGIAVSCAMPGRTVAFIAR
jgi:hypothetical protein